MCSSHGELAFIARSLCNRFYPSTENVLLTANGIWMSLFLVLCLFSPLSVLYSFITVSLSECAPEVSTMAGAMGNVKVTT
jgi:hypothetical protein